MVSIRSTMREVPDPRGRQGLLHPPHALPVPMPLSTLDGRRGMMAAFRPGRGPTNENTGCRSVDNGLGTFGRN